MMHGEEGRGPSRASPDDEGTHGLSPPVAIAPFTGGEAFDDNFEEGGMRVKMSSL
ncbi:uncharacterized protein DS421_10g296130 [Arachis hypogaea]|nr:uncharacterized protein DS421_10g296130 [Arachis hypogaea]